METFLNFLSNILSSWPLVVLVIILLFHKEIGENVKLLFELLSRMKSVTIGENSATFSEQLAKIAHQTDEADTDLAIRRSDQSKNDGYFSTEEEFENLAEMRPDFAILDSWQPVERKLNEIGQQKFQQQGTTSYVLSELKKMTVISPNQFLFIKENMALRNKVIHHEFRAISYSDAVLYRKNCLAIMQILDDASERITSER